MKFKNSFYPAAAFLIMILFTEAFISSLSNKINVNQKIKDLKDTVWIFNGKDLSNLKLVLENKNLNAGSLYNIENKILYFTSEPKGYLRTKVKYSNFYLHAEWMWTQKQEQGNSGILLYIQSPDTVWPNCIQVNLKANHAGDLIAMDGASFNEAEGKPKNTAVILSASSEKPEGEWNSCNIISINDSMIVYINDVLQNKATKIINNSGTIGLQLEGKSIAFKNIYLIKK
jgi:3-keto-disaccharide hydrolase